MNMSAVLEPTLFPVTVLHIQVYTTCPVISTISKGYQNITNITVTLNKQKRKGSARCCSLFTWHIILNMHFVFSKGFLNF